MSIKNIGLGLQTRLSEEQRQRLFHWRDRVFPEEGQAFSWAEPREHIVALQGDLAVGHIGFGFYRVEDLGRKQEHEVIGVGGVVVRPECQGQKIPQTMFNFLHQMEDIRARIFTLFCPERLTRYYERLGYSLYLGEITVLQQEKFISVAPIRFMYQGQVQFSDSLRVHSNPW